MKIRVLWLGKTKNSHLASVCEDLLVRAGHFFSVEAPFIKEPHLRDEKKRVEIEGERLLKALAPTDFVVAMDPLGRTFTSDEFADFLRRHLSDNPRDIAFIVGGHAGLSNAVRTRADLTWSLSSLTYSHDLARAVLAEQIYRAATILHNHPYAR